MSDLQVFDKLKADVTLYVAPIKNIVVKSSIEMEVAVKTGREVKAWTKKVEDLRKSLVAPLNEQVKKINDYARQILSPLEDSEKLIKSHLVLWEKHLETQRREDMARIEKRRQESLFAAKKKQEEDAKAIEELPLDDSDLGRERLVSQVQANRVSDQIYKDAKKEEKAVSQMKVSNTRKIWKFHVEDINKVPHEYLALDAVLVRQAISKGITEIPGLRVYQETVAAL